MIRPSWMKSVPDTWRVVPFGSIFKHINERNSNLERSTVLSVMRNRGVILYSEKGNVGNKVSDDLSKYKVVDRGDFVLNSMNLYMGSVGVSSYNGVTSSAYIVCRPSAAVNASFFEYVIQCRGFQEYVGLLGKGIMEIREAVRWTALKSVLVPLPDPTTQNRIADFLDRETARIDQLIEKKQRLVVLLEEKRESLVERAINQNGPYTKLGHHVTILSGYAFPSAEFSSDPDDVRLLRGANISPGFLRWDETVHWPWNRVNEVRRLLLHQGDVVLGMDRPWISSGIRVAELTAEDVPALLLQRVCRIEPQSSLDKRYMKLLLMSRRFLAYFEPILTGVSVPHISADQIEGFKFPYVDKKMQQEIAAECMAKLQSNRHLAQHVEHSIEVLMEFRSALITAAVTGQIDVDEWQRRETTDRRLDEIEEEMRV